MIQIWEACRADILNYIMIFLRSALVIVAVPHGLFRRW